MKKQHAVVALFLLILTGITLACTSFVLSGEHPFLAKNLDWELDRGYLHFNLAGIKKTQYLIRILNGFQNTTVSQTISLAKNSPWAV
ncbi:MAG: hypothetical protein U9Q91_01310 [Candidatus Marinimicrobia bacterium]|nr:hypothetical protein [Candidatus Neomarinimicrobiota bacterium]